jgi:hypothetical protein
MQRQKYVSLERWGIRIASTLQKVLSSRAPACWYCPAIIWYSAKDGEFGLEVFFQAHNGSDVATAIAVVRRRPDCYHILIFEVVFIAFVDELMGSCYKL